MTCNTHFFQTNKLWGDFHLIHKVLGTVLLQFYIKKPGNLKTPFSPQYISACQGEAMGGSTVFALPGNTVIEDESNKKIPAAIQSYVF